MTIPPPFPRLLAALALSVALGAVDARAGGSSRPVPSIGPPLLLRLDGVLAPTRDAARAGGGTSVSLGVPGGADGGTERWLGVTSARTIGGDQFLDGKDVLQLVAPFTPNFLVRGKPPLLERLRHAPLGTPVRLEGLVSRGSRTFHLRAVLLHPGASE
jgi:hypothetical protein